jgi:hypothetical protein
MIGAMPSEETVKGFASQLRTARRASTEITAAVSTEAGGQEPS